MELTHATKRAAFGIATIMAVPNRVLTAGCLTVCLTVPISQAYAAAPDRPPGNLNLAAQYQRANVELDAEYQQLSTQMNHTEQLILSNDQTTWLNQQTMQCAPNGEINYHCAIQLTEKRIASLSERKLPSGPQEVIATEHKHSHQAHAAIARITRPQAIPPPQPNTLPPPNPKLALATPATAIKPPAAPAKTKPQQAEPTTPPQLFTVAATAMPWIWRYGGINQNFSFGYPNGTPPTVVPLAPTGAHPGDTVIITYTGGRIAIGTNGPSADGNGYAGVLSNGEKSDLGALPSTYMTGFPINLGALVGAFTNAAGHLTGQPFAIGNGSVRQAVPQGASQLQLGINDDVFGGNSKESKNSGGFTVSVAVLKADTEK